MSKKYVPSGYQIINIDVTAKTSGTAFTPETEDEKLLFEILTKQSLSNQKPILLHVISSDWDMCGFGTLSIGALTLTIGAVGSTITQGFSISGSKLMWVQSEE